ncbi:hypothetical protein D3C75_1249210 [compost metagenome]
MQQNILEHNLQFISTEKKGEYPKHFSKEMMRGPWVGVPGIGNQVLLMMYMSKGLRINESKVALSVLGWNGFILCWSILLCKFF